MTVLISDKTRTWSEHRRAGIAQLIERFLAKEEARSLSLLTRTKNEISVFNEPVIGFICFIRHI